MTFSPLTLRYDINALSVFLNIILIFLYRVSFGAYCGLCAARRTSEADHLRIPDCYVVAGKKTCIQEYQISTVRDTFTSTTDLLCDMKLNFVRLAIKWEQYSIKKSIFKQHKYCERDFNVFPVYLLFTFVIRVFLWPLWTISNKRAEYVKLTSDNKIISVS